MSDSTVATDAAGRLLAQDDALTPAEARRLIEELQQGGEGAYEYLISRFQQPVFSLVYRLLNDPADASDVVQEVFLKVFRNIGQFRGDSSLKTWIYRIAVNEAHNHRRWFGRHKQREVGLDGQDNHHGFYETLCDPGQSPFDMTLGQEQHALMEEALNSLKAPFRAAVVLRDIEDLSYEEIAEVTEVSIGTVKSRILRGREALRRVLLERLDGVATPSLAPQPIE